MEQFYVSLTFLTIIFKVLATPTPIEVSCTKHDADRHCIISNITLKSTSASQYSFPKESVIHLENCTIDYFSSKLAEKLSDATVELSIVDGNVPKVYVKPTLKTLTSLRSATSVVLIDAVENHNLEVLDIAGDLHAVPKKVQHLKNLQVLDLCRNQIEQVTLDHFQGLNHLRKLNLGQNRINSISSSSDVNLPALTELFLQGNQLRTLDLTHLKADNLQRFYASENQLTRIDGFPGRRFSSLVRVDLFRNEWNCEWLKETLQTLNDTEVETRSYLPKTEQDCDERSTVKVDAIECQAVGNA
ncbi:leucine-rich repeat-containing protein 19-like [Sabethes cyaneus]|uniref:leucine-rich repeat-containing protein 19-like n=1 Tax=Sabethes cyaneus TaxID=53552 RepID=UPI00237EBE72|nr:leucine-rich repeat-containing protein 19-like [Sabethes cyaneus]